MPLAQKTVPFDTVSDSGGADQTRTDETVMVAGAGVFVQKKTVSCDTVSDSGGADQTRTDDPLLAKQVLYQLSYNPRTLRLSFESPHILFFCNIKVKIFLVFLFFIL